MKHDGHRPVILVHYGELGLKGKNQLMFRGRLRENLRVRLRGLGLDWKVEDLLDFIVINVPAEAQSQTHSQAIEAAREVPGVAWVASATLIPHRRFAVANRAADFASLENELVTLAREQFQPGTTFALHVRRGDKSLPFKSPEFEARLGALLRERTAWKKVNLSRPDTTFNLDIREHASYVFANKIRGPGGLPVGTAGRVISLLSGGIDSPVAAYLMARRGCRVDFIHFTASSVQPAEMANDKVCRLARRLSDFTLGSRLHIVSFGRFDLALLPHNVEYGLLLFRRFMLRVAETLARKRGAQALVTGDNLSQVASQTLSNLVAAQRAVAMPVFQPLLGYDKDEIIALAERIGTYATSIEPYKDCCALIGTHPRVKSRHEALEKLEARIFPEYQKLIQQTLQEAFCLKTSPVLPAIAAMKVTADRH